MAISLPPEQWQIYKKPKQPTPYYRWRVWLRDGNIYDISDFYSKPPTNKYYIKVEKIGEAVYLVEGQKGFEG